MTTTCTTTTWADVFTGPYANLEGRGNRCVCVCYGRLALLQEGGAPVKDPLLTLSTGVLSGHDVYRGGRRMPRGTMYTKEDDVYQGGRVKSKGCPRESVESEVGMLSTIRFVRMSSKENGYCLIIAF